MTAIEKAVEWTGSELTREVERRSGARVSACLQCHKCSSGCPVAPEMDFVPSQVMRLIHLGAEEELLESGAIWVCASCETCSARCPMGIDVAAVMDALRMRAVERKAALGDRRGRSFNQALLRSVRWHGRVFELGMMALYKMASRDLFTDLDKMPRMISKRKLAFLPHFSRSTKEVRQLFKRADEEEKTR